MARFEIIIPYYQREPGLLLRALKSVFAQDVKDVRVVVVDDGSPRAAYLELTGLRTVDQARVKLVRQKNAGATAARNNGLANVSEDAQYIAFLDSDDEWLPDHLSRAADALDRTAAALFQDAVESDPEFSEGYAPVRSILAEDDFKQIEDSPNLLRVTNPLNVMAGEWFRHMHLSVTVVRADLARRLRFSSGFKLAEDFEFFCRCAASDNDWIIDERIGARRGDGLNLWHGSQTVETRYSQEKYFTLRALNKLKRVPALDEKTRQRVEDRIALYREQFYWAQRDRLKAGKPPNLELWAKLLLRDPGVSSFVVSHLAASGANKAKAAGE